MYVAQAQGGGGPQMCALRNKETYQVHTAKSLISCLYKVVLTLVQSDFFLVL